MLNRIYGGNWKYTPFRNMWTDNNDRIVTAVSHCSCDNDYCDHEPWYYFYGDGTPELICCGDSLRITLEAMIKQ